MGNVYFTVKLNANAHFCTFFAMQLRFTFMACDSFSQHVHVHACVTLWMDDVMAASAHDIP